MKETTQPILLVEDDPNDIFLIQRAFQKCNVAAPVQIVRDGDRAVAYLEGQGAYAERDRYPLPFLMLLDLKLPRRSGFDVLMWARLHDDRNVPPVVVLASSGEPQDVRRAYDLGASSYYVKPASFSQLLELVQAIQRDFPP